MLDSFGAGSLTALLDNQSRDFDAYYTPGPNYGDLLPNRQVRFAMQHPAPNIVYLHRGFGGGFPLDFTISENNTVSLQSTDAFKLLANTKLFGATEFPEELTGARLHRILNVAKVGWPATLRDIDAGSSIVAGGDFSEKSALEAMRQVAATENGYLFMDGLGRVKFVDRNALVTQSVYATSQLIFGDGGAGSGEIAYQALRLNPKDESLIRNDVQVTNPALEPVVAGNLASQNEYGTYSYSVDAIDAGQFAQAALAENLSALHAEPRARVLNLVVELHRNDGYYDVVLPLELGYRVTVRRRPNNDGVVIEDDFFIDSIAHDITPTKWSVTFTLGVVRDTEAWGVWDTAIWDTAEWGW